MSRSEMAELERQVVSLPLNEDPFKVVLPAIHRIFRSARTGAFGFVPVGERGRFQVDFMQMEGLDAHSLTKVRGLLDKAYAVSPRAQVAFDIRSPDPRQRNVFVDTHDIMRLVGTGRLPAGPVSFARTAKANLDEQLRALLCDKQVLLAEVTLFRSERFSPDEREQLASLFTLVRDRLLLTRQALPRDAVAVWLDAAMEAVGAPGFVADAAGRLLYANVAGRDRLAREWLDTRTLVTDAVHGRLHRGASCTRVSSPGLPEHHIVVIRDREQQLEAQATRASAQWRLTRRQGEVLRLVSRGLSNKSIGQLLGCAEHTAELHVSALLQRAGVESRSALAAVVAHF